MKLTALLKKYDHVIAAIAAFYVVYLFTRYSGIGVSPDSIMYTSTARNIAAHGRFNFFNGSPLVDFPLFYPAFLSFILKITGIDPIKAGPVLDGLLFAGLIWLSGYISLRFKNSSWLYKWLIVLLVLLSPALLQVFTYLWSETLFIFLTLVFFIAYRRFQLKRSIANIILVAVVAAVGSVTRYAGVTLIATGGFLLLVDLSLPLRRKLIYLFTYGPIAIALLTANLIRNALASGTSTGPREPSVTPFIQNLGYFGNTICGWLSVSGISTGISITVGAIVLVAFAAMLVIRILKRRFNGYEIITVAFAFIYGAFIILSSTFSRYERINDRLLAPMYIPFLWACTAWACKYLKWQRVNVNVAKGAVLTLLLLFIDYRLYKIDYQRYDDQSDYGVPGYTDDSWNTAKFTPFLRKNPQLFHSNYPVYSDAYEAVYFFTGQTVKLLPHRFFEQDIANFYNLKHFYLIWFKDLDNPELISIKDIRKQRKLVKLYEFPEGAVYKYDAP